jgi:hypothetical protein
MQVVQHHRPAGNADFGNIMTDRDAHFNQARLTIEYEFIWCDYRIQDSLIASCKLLAAGSFGPCIKCRERQDFCMDMPTRFHDGREKMSVSSAQ